MRARHALRTSRFIALAAAGVLGLAAAPVSATVFNWTTSLDVFQAGQLTAGTSNPDGVPGLPAASGTGTGSGTYDDVTRILTWSFDISGLGSAATLAHFHFGAPGVYRGPVRVETPSLDIGALLGQTSGSFSGSQDFDEAFTPGLPAGGVAQLETELLGGNWYINVHTRNFGAGEIRGQINVVPEPSSVLLLTLALSGLGLAAIRRRPAGGRTTA